MTSSLDKFGLLLWKNYILQKRHKVQTVFEVLLPLAFTAILILVRDIADSETHDQPTYFQPYLANSYTHLTDTQEMEVSRVLKGTHIYYAPNNSITDEIMKKVIENHFTDLRPHQANTTANTYTYTLVSFPSEEALLAEYMGGSMEHAIPVVDLPVPSWLWWNKNPVLAAVVFRSDFSDELPSDIRYSLRFPATQHDDDGASGAYSPKWLTELVFPLFQLLGPRDADENEGGEPFYWLEGFTYLQNAVESSIYSIATDEEDPPYDIYLHRFPYPKYIDDVFLIALQGFFPLIMMLSFIYTVINITKSVVHEKERRLKESMKMMGLPNWLHWSAWFTKSLMFLLISIILMTALMKIRFSGGLAILTYSNGFLIFFFFLAFIFSLITMCFFISSLFSTANSAATAAGVLFFLSYFPYFFLQPRYDSLSKSTKIGSSLLGPTAMAFGCQIISMFEGTGAGVQWSTIASGSSPDENFTMLDIIILLFFDGFLYLFLALYIEAVWPGEFGVPLPWYFPFTKWYWCGTPRNSESFDGGDFKSSTTDPQYFETEPKGKAGVQIQGLTKIFDKNIAVNGLSLNMYDDQITALLGHNGAGKTTTMSMLTGLFPPSGGSALVNGFNIRDDIKSVRDSLGLCPQHDVLFDELTVEEHLRFFCRMKGLVAEQVPQEIDRMLGALGIENKRHAQSQTLSGGMKRKLSVGIALCGGSKVVLLDEPTSGMDPGARRSTWDLLQSEKKNRTLVLSTHFMDEADLLGDRIAIMADGQVQCCGSSLFLKKKYGGGYHLVIVKHPHCVVENITNLLRQKIPDIEVDQNVGAELSYSLPDEKSSFFPSMFEELERRKTELGIASYGASITTMEEVFMRVGKIIDEKARRVHADDAKITKVVNVSMETLQTGSKYKLHENETRNTGIRLLFQQLRAMIVKKCLYGIRNRALLAAQTIIPVAFLIITLIMLETLPGTDDPEEFAFTLDKYNDPVTLYQCDTQSTMPICTNYEKLAGSASELRASENVQLDYIAQGEKDLPTMRNSFIVGLQENITAEGSNSLSAFYNNQPYHTPPLALTLLYNALLLASTDNPNYLISMSNQPLPYNIEDKVNEAGSAQSSGFQIGFNIAFGMSFLSSSFVVFLIKERMTKAKHLQFVSGVKFPIFWLASFLFDIVNYIIPCFLLMIVLLAFQAEDFTSGKIQGCLLLLFIMYGWAVIPLMYLFSFTFTIPSTGFTRMVMFNVFTGMATILAVSILQIPSLELENIADAMDWIFMLFPNYNLGMGISQLSAAVQLNELCPVFRLANPPVYCSLDENLDHDCCEKFGNGYLGWNKNGIGRNLLFLFLVGAASFGVLFIAEAKIIEKIRFRKNKQQGDAHTDDPLALEDSDVAAENSRIRKTNLTQLFKTDNLILRDLTKLYKNFTAVDKICLGVQKGECFGLLGVNGAGKTTTFKMLTGDLPITSGDAFVHSNSVKSEIKKVQRDVGYCPQFDAIIEELTGRETIRLFARLRGVPEGLIDNLVDLLGANLLFTEHLEKRCGAYSGGNKRKLSTSLALVGNPPIVFLDEPTTGMDPVARRHLWNAISEVRNSGTSIVLTSHSMEECEALCSRLSIMVNGKFRCIGSPQHLKNKFGEGYTLIAQIVNRSEESTNRMSQEVARRRSSTIDNKSPAWERDLQPLRTYIERSFPGCTLKDVHPGYVHYHITDSNVSWGSMFQKMEVAKTQFNLEAYSVGQTSLDQVFLNFTKAQVNAE